MTSQGRGEDPGDPVDGESVPILNTDPDFDKRTYTFDEPDQIPYSIYTYTITANTDFGEGEPSDPVTCETERGGR